jgi:hypothetical protein
VNDYAVLLPLIKGLGWDILEAVDEEDFVDLSHDAKERFLLKGLWRTIMSHKDEFFSLQPRPYTRLSKHLGQWQTLSVLNLYGAVVSQRYTDYARPPTSCTWKQLLHPDQHLTAYPELLNALHQPFHVLLLMSNNLVMDDMHYLLQFLASRPRFTVLNLSYNRLRPEETLFCAQRYSCYALLMALAQHALFINVRGEGNRLASIDGSDEWCSLPFEQLGQFIWIPTRILKHPSREWHKMFDRITDLENRAERIRVVEAVHLSYEKQGIEDLALADLH